MPNTSSKAAAAPIVMCSMVPSVPTLSHNGYEDIEEVHVECISNVSSGNQSIMGMAWGGGNSMACYETYGNNNASSSSSSTTTSMSSRSPSVYLAVRGEVLSMPIVRSLISEAHSVFMSLQQAMAATSMDVDQSDNSMVIGSTSSLSKTRHLILASRHYRAVLHTASSDLDAAASNMITTDTASSETSAQSILYRHMELLWHLCELLLIDNANVSVVRRLEEWVQWFAAPFNVTSIILEAHHPELHDSFWPTLRQMVLLGELKEARGLLTHHSSWGGGGAEAGPLASMDDLLRRMPRLHDGRASSEFSMAWQRWHEDVLFRGEQDFGSIEELAVLGRIVGGDVATIQRYSRNWYECLVSTLMYTAPGVKIFDLRYFTLSCTDAFGGDAELGPMDRLMLAALDLDVSLVLRDAARFLDWWFAAHLTDVLHHAGQVPEPPPLNFGSDVREYFLLEFARSLMTDDALWQITVDYLAHCPVFGRHDMAAFLLRVPFTTESKARKIASLCERHGLVEEAADVRAVAGRRALDRDRLGPALTWFVEARDATMTSGIAERLLTTYYQQGVFIHSSLLDSLGSEVASMSDRLAFLVGYREMHRLYARGQLVDAGQLLYDLLNSRLAPMQFWLTLLLDAVPLLESGNDSSNGQTDVAPIFSAHQTYDLMRCLETVELSHRHEEYINNSNCNSGSKHSTEDQAAILDGNGNDGNDSGTSMKHYISVIRLALTRNLARGLLV